MVRQYDRRGQDEDYALMQAYIDLVDADIWFLQEVENEAAIVRVFNDGQDSKVRLSAF